MNQCTLFFFSFLSVAVTTFLIFKTVSFFEKYTLLDFKLKYPAILSEHKYQISVMSVLLFFCLSFNIAYFNKRNYNSHGEVRFLGQTVVYSYCDKKEEEIKEESDDSDSETEYAIALINKQNCLGV